MTRFLQRLSKKASSGTVVDQAGSSLEDLSSDVIDSLKNMLPERVSLMYGSCEGDLREWRKESTVPAEDPFQAPEDQQLFFFGEKLLHLLRSLELPHVAHLSNPTTASRKVNAQTQGDCTILRGEGWEKFFAQPAPLLFTDSFNATLAYHRPILMNMCGFSAIPSTFASGLLPSTADHRADGSVVRFVGEQLMCVMRRLAQLSPLYLFCGALCALRMEYLHQQLIEKKREDEPVQAHAALANTDVELCVSHALQNIKKEFQEALDAGGEVEEKVSAQVNMHSFVERIATLFVDGSRDSSTSSSLVCTLVAQSLFHLCQEHVDIAKEECRMEAVSESLAPPTVSSTFVPVAVFSRLIDFYCRRVLEDLSQCKNQRARIPQDPLLVGTLMAVTLNCPWGSSSTTSVSAIGKEENVNDEDVEYGSEAVHAGAPRRRPKRKRAWRVRGDERSSSDSDGWGSDDSDEWERPRGRYRGSDATGQQPLSPITAQSLSVSLASTVLSLYAIPRANASNLQQEGSIAEGGSLFYKELSSRTGSLQWTAIARQNEGTEMLDSVSKA